MFIRLCSPAIILLRLSILSVLLNCGVFQAFGQSSISGLPFVRTFPTVEYRAGIQNWAITQDRRGIMYVANNYGLLEFDGVQWQRYPVKNGTKVRSVAIDGRGRIYVGSQNEFGYFSPDKTGSLQYVSLADSLPPAYRNFDEAWSIFIDKETVYFCTFSRIYIFDGQRFRVVDQQTPLDLSFLVNRTLFCSVRNIGVGRLTNDRIEPMPGGKFFIDKSISSILPLGADVLLISTFQEGIYTMTNGVIQSWNETLQTMFREAHVNCMIRLKNGNFAAGTQNNGLLILSPKGDLLMQLTRGRGLENRTVLSLYEDDLHNLWAGQNNGVTHVELGSPFTFISEQNGLPGTGYAAFLDDKTFYLGTNTGLYARDRNVPGDFRLIGNSRGQVYHIGKYRSSILLGHHQGAFQIEGAALPLSREPGSWVFVVSKKNPDKLIEGTYSGLQLYSWENGSWRLRKKLSGFDESARVMAEDESGNLWVTHGYKGAYKIQLDLKNDSILKVDHYGPEKGFPSHILINVFNVRNELLFTSERGVFKYDVATDRFVPDELFSSLLPRDAQIWYMQEDAFGNIYFAGASQIGVLRKNSIGEYAMEDNYFNKIRRFLNDDLVNISILQNNDVLFGAKDGFIHFDPTRRNLVHENFRTLIRRVSVTSRGDSVLFAGNFRRGDAVVDSQQEADAPDLRYADNSLHFSFAATTYEGNDERSYQFYLENYESGWSEWSSQTRKEYTNLKEGQYIFHVRAKNSNGQHSKEAVFHFSIRPPWYRSIIAYILYSISIMALLFFAFNLLDRKYQREQKILEEKQQEELGKKEIEIEKIAQQSQEEITRLQNEKLEADLQHMNNELATATMHLLNKNEFITGIKNQLNHIVKKNGTDDSRKELQQIAKDIENNISADADWEHFQFHFDRVHGDFTNRFRTAFPGLSPQEIKLSAYLRMNLSTKEIAQLLNISVRGVEISRYRLRKKLHLDRNQNLQDFILNF
jgi:DNA-binding CsgD family transcriptional regulator